MKEFKLVLWFRLTLVGVVAVAALALVTGIGQPARAQQLHVRADRFSPPPHPLAAPQGEIGVIRFDDAGQMTGLFDVDGSFQGPQWNQVTAGSALANGDVHLAYNSSTGSVWFGDPIKGEFGGIGCDEPECPIHAGTLTMNSVQPIPSDDDFAFLSFWSWEETEMSIDEELFSCFEAAYCQFDVRSVLISSTNQPVWSLVWTTESNFSPPTLEQAWHQVAIDISEYLGDEIQIRFSFDTVDKRNNDFRGWYIDDIKLQTLQFNAFLYIPLLYKN